jgi:hypothetical protein
MGGGPSTAFGGGHLTTSVGHPALEGTVRDNADQYLERRSHGSSQFDQPAALGQGDVDPRWQLGSKDSVLFLQIGDLSKQVRLGGRGKQTHQMMDKTGHEAKSRKYLWLRDVTSILYSAETCTLTSYSGGRHPADFPCRHEPQLLRKEGFWLRVMSYRQFFFEIAPALTSEPHNDPTNDVSLAEAVSYAASAFCCVEACH